MKTILMPDFSNDTHRSFHLVEMKAILKSGWGLMLLTICTLACSSDDKDVTPDIGSTSSPITAALLTTTNNNTSCSASSGRKHSLQPKAGFKAKRIQLQKYTLHPNAICRKTQFHVLYKIIYIPLYQTALQMHLTRHYICPIGHNLSSICIK